jgi:hypothetical protein
MLFYPDNMFRRIFILLILSAFSLNANAQINQDKIGAWYMYFFATAYKDTKWGFQGDVQLRNWNLGGDLEQLLIRGGLTYKPKDANIKFTLGYGDVTSGAFGEDNNTTRESRIYQEALFPVKIGSRFHMNHRIRYEQRFVEEQDLRTRYRYNLFLTVGLTAKELKKNTLYLSLYNEIFINGQRNIGDGNTVEIFDRNRFYAALGYLITDKLKIQCGLMNQTTNGWKKNQLQLSVHQKF